MQYPVIYSKIIRQCNLFIGLVLLIAFLRTREKIQTRLKRYGTYLIEFLYSGNLNVSGYQYLGTSCS